MRFNPIEIILLLLATIGPLKVTIVCAGLTATAPPTFLPKLALRSVLVALIICLVFVVLGEAILDVFKVSVPAFQLGGGLIVLLFALDMVAGKKETPATADDGLAAPGAAAREPSLDLAVCPLAIPLMASVSGLVAIVSLMAQRHDLAAILFLAGIVAAIMGLNYVCLRSCQLLVKWVGPLTLQVVSRIMGVLLVALAFELMLMGLSGVGLITRPT
jgi:multiple antibiotic resistance protein